MLPQFHNLVFAGARDTFAVQTPVQREDLVFMAGQVLFEFPDAHVPHLDGGVFARGRQEARITRPGGHVDGSHVAAQRGDKLAVSCVPQLDAIVEASGCDACAVGGEGDVQDLLLMAEEAGDGLDGGVGRVVDRGGIPQEYRVVVGRRQEFLDELAFVACGVFEAFLGLLDSFFDRVGDFARVVVVGGAKGKVGREGEVVNPMGV